MPRYIPQDFNQSRLLAVCLSHQLMPGTLEFAIHELIEKEMDLSELDGRYRNEDGGRPAYDPRVLLKAVLLAYSRGV